MPVPLTGGLPTFLSSHVGSGSSTFSRTLQGVLLKPEVNLPLVLATVQQVPSPVFEPQPVGPQVQVALGRPETSMRALL